MKDSVYNNLYSNEQHILRIYNDNNNNAHDI